MKSGEAMTLHQPTWETTLLDWATTALSTQIPERKQLAESDTLDAAYRYCAALTRQHSKTFYLASGLLPAEQRRATRALYAFCRVTDNIVDEAANDYDRKVDLTRWRRLLREEHPSPCEYVTLAWADARAHYNIPSGYAEQLIDGVARDIEQTRYTTFDELAAYSYGVASTVGLMAMHIIGFAGEQALPYAVKLGVALQMTNILRDISEDWERGRVYLPQEELAAFGLDEGVIAEKRWDHPRWAEFMRFQIERNRRLYDEGFPGIALLNAEGRFAIAAAAELYRAILSDIEAHRYDVFSRRASLSAASKAVRLPMIWWRSRTTAL
ncbi:phytoene/squalene synthase family protein [Anaerolineae bacterium CFX9]|nr:phytoene/squalene synthase family protein [Anaerolineae bacterium CFX9]